MTNQFPGGHGHHGNGVPRAPGFPPGQIEDDLASFHPEPEILTPGFVQNGPATPVGHRHRASTVPGPLLQDPFRVPQNLPIAPQAHFPALHSGGAGFASSPAPSMSPNRFNGQQGGYLGHGPENDGGRIPLMGVFQPQHQPALNFQVDQRMPPPQYGNFQAQAPVDNARRMDGIAGRMDKLEKKLQDNYEAYRKGHSARSEEMVEIKRKIDNVQHSVGVETKQNIDAMLKTVRAENKQKVDAVQHRIAAVEEGVKNRKRNISDSGLPTAIRNVPGRVAKLEANLSANANKISDLEKRIRDLEEKNNQQGQVAGSISNSVPPKRYLSDSQITEPGESHLPKRAKDAMHGLDLSSVVGYNMPTCDGKAEGNTADLLQSFIQLIKNIDFASIAEMTALKGQLEGSASLEFPIFHYDRVGEAPGPSWQETFYLKVGGAMRNSVTTSPRANHDIDGLVLRCVLTAKNLPMEQDGVDTVPEYLIPLGEMYKKTVYTTHSATERDTTEATNYFVFLSVPHKSVWAIYLHERVLANGETRMISFKTEDRLFQGGQVSDAFCLLKSVENWASHEEDMIQTSAEVTEVFWPGIEPKRIMAPLFSKPRYQDLKAVIDGRKSDDAMSDAM
ncbi:hypothetical protein B0T16DRAFT_445960 [Cercophora newfieldiana]|uniref:Uncharacterized protein n=1 Tax=Cercophora newfieldiana TaxID=92897 RepID=A0AA39Y6K1_9PEZI|nr:hypothetical protein B0T16DRAFT_445960 [Cercophora newfieldiana]